MLTLGSEWHVYRPETADLVAAEAAYVRSIVARQVPLLAICFGAQVLSHALGGTVSRADAIPEIGWYEPALGARVRRPSPPGRGWSGTTTCSRRRRASTSWRRPPAGRS